MKRNDTKIVKGGVNPRRSDDTVGQFLSYPEDVHLKVYTPTV